MLLNRQYPWRQTALDGIARIWRLVFIFFVASAGVILVQVFWSISNTMLVVLEYFFFAGLYYHGDGFLFTLLYQGLGIDTVTLRC
ncbi:hypothetical protein QBC35DRAFT_484122 [Podospora australis]|uniref:Uncharacterized protein n=1 Tax=Podospora australis TaxID=1536484 RepID=A0AAN6X2Q2_9PEZI|nr:hypothetical protein QBC35DRAFT_484122 [Podospora australis]